MTTLLDRLGGREWLEFCTGGKVEVLEEFSDSLVLKGDCGYAVCEYSEEDKEYYYSDTSSNSRWYVEEDIGKLIKRISADFGFDLDPFNTLGS